MTDVTLATEIRTETGSRPAGRQRRQGLVPAVVYGLQAEPVHVTVSARELQHILAGEAGINTLITLRIDGGDQLTFARELQRDPVRGDLVHVDFVRVDVDVAVTADVPIELVGEPEGVREGGILDHSLFTLTVEAKPNAIPSSIPVDVSGLAIGDQVRVEALSVPAEVTVLTDGEELVASVVVPAVEAEPEAEAEVEGVEGVEGEVPTEEGAAGEPAAEAEAGGESAESD